MMAMREASAPSHRQPFSCPLMVCEPGVLYSSCMYSQQLAGKCVQGEKDKRINPWLSIYFKMLSCGSVDQGTEARMLCSGCPVQWISSS